MAVYSKLVIIVKFSNMQIKRHALFYLVNLSIKLWLKLCFYLKCVLFMINIVSTNYHTCQVVKSPLLKLVVLQRDSNPILAGVSQRSILENQLSKAGIDAQSRLGKLSICQFRWDRPVRVFCILVPRCENRLHYDYLNLGKKDGLPFCFSEPP